VLTAALTVINLEFLVAAHYASDQSASPGTASLAMDPMNEGTKNRTDLETNEELYILGYTARYSAPKPVPKFLTPDQITKVMEVARDDNRDAYLFFALGMFAGMRKSEIDHAGWEWFDFENRIITLQSERGFVLKDKDAGTIALSGDLAHILRPYYQESGYIIKPDKQPHGSGVPNSPFNLRADHIPRRNSCPYSGLQPPARGISIPFRPLFGLPLRTKSAR